MSVKIQGFVQRALKSVPGIAFTATIHSRGERSPSPAAQGSVQLIDEPRFPGEKRASNAIAKGKYSDVGLPPSQHVKYSTGIQKCAHIRGSCGIGRYTFVAGHSPEVPELASFES